MDIKEIRTKLNLTQQELAQQIGVSVVVISRWERGVSHPSKLAQRELARLEKRVK